MSPEKVHLSGVVTGEHKSSRRDVLKRALMVLGAGVILQPHGGVSGLAFGDEPKKKDKDKDMRPDKDKDARPDKDRRRKHTNKTYEPPMMKKRGKKKHDTPKK